MQEHELFTFPPNASLLQPLHSPISSLHHSRRKPFFPALAPTLLSPAISSLKDCYHTFCAETNRLEMAPSRRLSNGRSPLVNKQSQITSFFNKNADSITSSDPSPPKKTRQKENPIPSREGSPRPITPSPLQTKRKKPLLVIPSEESRPAVMKSQGSEVVGKRVRVYWSLDESWYEGCVKAYDEESDRHVIVYDDGEEEALELAKEKVEWVEEGKRRLQRLRRGDGDRFEAKIVGIIDFEVKEDELEEEDGDDEDDSDDDCDDTGLVDEVEYSDIAVGRAGRKARSRKRKVEEVNAEESGKKKCSSISRTEGKTEVLALRPDMDNNSKLKGV